MKTMNYGAGLALAAYLVLALAACSKTDNGSNNSNTAVAATQCTMSYDGTYRNQYGQPCSNLSYTCAGYTYNAQTGTYINPQNGQQIPASQCGGTNVIPNQGYYGNNYVSGCQQWTNYYGVYYVPVDIGGGQLVCANYQYLQQQIVVQYPSFQYTPYYNNPNYWYTNYPYAYDYGYGGYGYGQGYGYGGYGYGCGTGINLGLSTGGFSGGVSLCFN